MKNKIIEIGGCYNCFMCSIEDITKKYFCSIAPLKTLKITKTPKWCPLKKNNIVFKLKTK